MKEVTLSYKTQKKWTLIFLIFSFFYSNAQNVGINKDGSTPDPLAILDIKSDSSGVLIPRTDTAAINAAGTPVAGLLIYQINDHTFYYYDNTKWVGLSTAIQDTLPLIIDEDRDSYVHVEENADEDFIRFYTNGVEHFRMDSGRLEVFNTGNSVFIGQNAGANDDLSNNRNVYIGPGAGAAGTGANHNIAIGNNALVANTAGEGNIVLGRQAGRIVQTHLNVSIGHFSLFNGDSIQRSVAIGNYAMRNADNGDLNVALGNAALYSLKGTSYDNPAEGNIAVGAFAGYNLVDGSRNTLIGKSSGNNSVGSGNVFLGYESGRNETGDDKLYIENTNSTTPLIWGDFSNDSVKIYGTLGIRDAYVFPAADGTSSQVLSTDGSGTLNWVTPTDADAQGIDSLALIGSGLHISLDNNANVGSVDLSSFLDADDLGNHTASQNIQTNSKWISGDGGNEGVYVDSVGNVGIQTNAPSYALQVGTNGDGTEARANAWNTFSDRRWKTDFKIIENALEKLQAVNGYYYKWKNRPDTTTQVGVIAQEIEAILPDIVATDVNGYKSVDYSKLTALLIEAVKEQQKIVEIQVYKINQLELKTEVNSNSIQEMKIMLEQFSINKLFVPAIKKIPSEEKQL